ncbi:DUF302 domain-containing protein [Comamonas sp. Y6]|uniref:DUF302 domain-containing protein n=1 Tax=Comamonas resistens TaxID=3046670 RepID=A0ABY8STL8_9BURK|nr:DUF302 domain-containing protein [Comamonas resistens]MDL5035863.1 DUF302 domain-containing protein [Comamonas resistens]WHS65269.1 DUF302 domain-containing protein [Comamonas resistens]HBP0978939.1 DUF302 domain-containing protein [Pseudomonas aeruginosa]
MFINHRSLAGLILGLTCLLVAVPAVAETHWPKDGWKVIDTSQSYSELLANLKKAVSANELNVIYEVGPTEAAAKRGIHIPGIRVVGVFNNKFAVDIFRLSVLAMIEVTIRFYVTERDEGHATLSWVEPSLVLAPYVGDVGSSDDANTLRQKAEELDACFSRIASETVQGK